MVDEASFTRESMALVPALYRICMSILHCDADAQDAVQQSLLNAWAHRGAAQPERFRAWLTKIAVNECYNIRRYRKRVCPVEEIWDAREAEAPDLSVAEAVASLNEKLRMPLLLKYRENFSEREIAQALRIPVSTVKSRLFRARRALKTALQDLEVSFE